MGVEARLQHPLGVSLASEFGPLIVADSYNNKVRLKLLHLLFFMSKFYLRNVIKNIL